MSNVPFCGRSLVLFPYAADQTQSRAGGVVRYGAWERWDWRDAGGIGCRNRMKMEL